MTSKAFALAGIIGDDNKINLASLPEEATQSDAIGTVTGSDLDLSTGNFFEVTANDQDLVFSNSPAVHDFKIKLTGGGTVSGYRLSAAQFDSVSFSVASQDTAPQGLSFNNDGTKMYIAGVISDSVYQYTLSTSFDLSTASYDSVSFSVASQDGNPYGLAFNNDGTKMYIVGNSNDSVYQYTLSAAFDLSTASYDGVSFSVFGQESTPTGLSFNNDGTKMYIVGSTGDSVYQYTLSAAFDLSTASYDSVSFSVASQDTIPTSVFFKPDGTKMYIVGANGDSVYQYSTSDITTATMTYPNSVKFTNSTPPTIPDLGEVDTIEFYTIDGGTTYYAYQSGDNQG